MPSRTKTPKNMILKVAFDMLIRDGYSALNIKSLARELNCSTQPISWHFGNMDGLRKALAEYALSYANKKMSPLAQKGFEAFNEVGAAYINIAFEEPNLFQFLYMGGSSGYCFKELPALIGATDYSALISNIANELSISVDNAFNYIQNYLIYIHGIVSLIVSGVLKCTKTEVIEMVNHAGYAFLSQAGVELSKIAYLNSHK